MAKILVTGGAGFLGNKLCFELLKNQNEVICVDNFYTGSKLNIKELYDYDNFELIRHDVTFPLYVEVDQIYNLACPASPIHYQKNPVQTIKTAVHGTINMLGLAKRTGASYLQASTSEIYGDPEMHPQKENYWGNVNPIGIRSCYDEGKRCGETLCMDYQRQYNVNASIVRIFNTYGPKMDVDDGRVVSNFIVQALHKKDITIYGDGTQTRSFCYLDDLVDGLILAMKKNNWTWCNQENRMINLPINLGNPNEFTVKELAEMIIDITQSSSKIIFQDLPMDDPKQRQPDISIAKEKLEWKPKIELRDGLIRTIDWFKYYFNRLYSK